MNPDEIENPIGVEPVVKKKRRAPAKKVTATGESLTVKKPRARRIPKGDAVSVQPVQVQAGFPYKKLLAVNAIFFALVAFSLWQVNRNDALQNAELPTPPEIAGIVSTTSPVKLIIPTIKVDAEIQRVGKTSAGKMAVPTNFVDVGWYKYGFLPGTVGNAVIAGHLDNGKGKPAVMNDLSQLRIGDSVFVTNKDGQTLKFSVTGMSLYDYNNAPLDMIFGSSTKAHLNLITCDGVWDQSKKNYDKRLVVFTDFVGIVERVEEEPAPKP